MIESFSEEKKNILRKLRKLENEFIKVEKQFEIDLSEVREKVTKGIENMEKEKFSIAFFGAFSDGKSSLLSVLTNRLDIKISPEPTTDKVTTYEYHDYFVVDTPGLFSDDLKHDETTKKYISEANVIIFTVDSVNPLKKSQHPTIKWLFDDLAKADSVIFVLNKMDAIADLEDNENFAKKCEIKKNVVLTTLKEIVELKSPPKILCVSADPYGQGLPNWFSNIEEYKRLSRIDNVFKSLDSFIDSAKENLIVKAGISILKETKEKTIEKLNKLKQKTEKEISVLNNQEEELYNRLNRLKSEINMKYTNIKSEIINFRKNILLSIESVNSVSALKDWINTEIGSEGHILQEKINTIIEKYTYGLLKEEGTLLKLTESSLQTRINDQESLATSFAIIGANFGHSILNQSTNNLRNIILNLRNTL